jgi:RNA polymerase sigma factor (sigma-70 family)
MTPKGSVTHLIEVIQNGGGGERETALADLWKRYFPRLLEVATGLLSPRVRTRVDGEDVLQVVFQVFFDRLQRGKFELANRDDLWALLCDITRKKARKAASREQAIKRDYRREQPHSADEGDALDWLLTASDPSAVSPDEATMAVEGLQELLAPLDESQRRIALLKLQGHTHEEIAGQLGCVVRTVERKVEGIRRLWEDSGPSPQ